MKLKKIRLFALALAVLLFPLVLTSCEHEHRYVVSYENAPTCTASGEVEYECAICGEYYRTRRDPVGHNYVLDERPVTCTTAGHRTERCSVCGDTRTETIPAAGHSYTGGNCAEPQPCATCGESVTFAHVGEKNFCERCHACTFETLTYSGSGTGKIEGVSLPHGNYEITVTYTGEYNLSLYLNDIPLVSDYGENTFIYQLKPSEPTGILNSFGTPVTNGVFEVRTSGGDWTVTVTAVRG